MPQNVFIKLVKASPRSGPFTISDNLGNVIATDVPKSQLIDGVVYSVNSAASVITITSTGGCKKSINFPISQVTPNEQVAATYTQSYSACIWRHLKNPVVYNYFYGNIEPYIIEYPFAYQYRDEILQSVQDYTKAYRYFSVCLMTTVRWKLMMHGSIKLYCTTVSSLLVCLSWFPNQSIT